MPPIRPHVSITLPRNFTFHYADGEAPRTPEPEPKEDIVEPPAPPQQTFRLRRKRGAIAVPSSPNSGPCEEPLPTIETPDSASDEYVPLPEFHSEMSIGYLAPATSFSRPISPPKTPVGQISENAGARIVDNDWQMSDETFRGQSISRPSSVCSNMSDSSVSSRGSFSSFPSRGGSCTSPESDAADPFMFPTLKSATAMVTSPLESSFEQRPMKRLRARKISSWTEEMDDHLWIIYMRYLQDPTVTPFKMLPGTAPPLGVCHRVAREAKRTWKGPKHVASMRNTPQPHPQRSHRSGSPDTLKAPKSSSNTPTKPQATRPYAPWPRSESATRRRLRHLCKRTPTLSAHYQRLLHGRSPSPFSSSSPHSKSDPKSDQVIPTSPSSASETQSSFARDMHISLATSTAVSMQPGGLLSQLASDITPRPARNQWFTEPRSRLAAHQKGQSLQLEFGPGGSQPRQTRTLDRPFTAAPRRPQLDTTLFQSETQPQPPPSEQREAPAPRLESPLELHAPVPLPRTFKRRHQQHLEELLNPSNSADGRSDLLQEVFGPPAEISHRRVRSRGFSFGDAGDGAQRLSALFSPPATQDQSATLSISNPGPSGDTFMQPPTEQIRRLASPFEEHSGRTYFNTFPRNFPHSTSYDPSVSFNKAHDQLASSDPFTSPMQG